MKKIKFLFLLIGCTFFSCKAQNKGYVGQSNTLINDTINIEYYSNGDIKNITLKNKNNNQIDYFEYYPNKLTSLKITNYDNFPKKYFQYDENGLLIQNWEEGDVGGCIGKINSEYFYNSEKLIKKIIHSSTDEPCSSKILISEEIEFHEDQISIKSIKFFQESYEGSEPCPCNSQKEYDLKGNLTKNEEFEICGKTISNCE